VLFVAKTFLATFPLVGCNQSAPVAERGVHGATSPAPEKSSHGMVGYNLAKRIYPTVCRKYNYFSSTCIHNIEDPEAGMKGCHSTLLLLCLRIKISRPILQPTPAPDIHGIAIKRILASVQNSNVAEIRCKQKKAWAASPLRHSSFFKHL